MAELKTPVTAGTCTVATVNGPMEQHVVLDRDRELLCECRFLDDAILVGEAINRDAQHAETVRKLTEQAARYRSVIESVANECPTCGGTDLRRDSDLRCATMWCDDCGAGNNHAAAARAAIAAAEGGGT